MFSYLCTQNIKSDYVMLPRLQHPGLKPNYIERDAFKAELKQEPSFIKERVLALYDAVYWWYEYGKNKILKD